MTDNILTDPQSLNTPIRPTWCPGCGNFSIWHAIKTAIVSLGVPHENVVISFDVGCSGNMADFIRGYGIHALHGRAVPPAVGIKLANHDLKVIVVIGDGGGYGEGLTHLLNEMRGNHDITVLAHNNHRYSLTTGQMSPTTPKGTATKSTPLGSIERELNPIALALTNHATFVAREFAVDVKTLTGRIVEAVSHVGFSLIDILQPCMVFNPEMDTRWYMEHIEKLDALGHNPGDKENALKQALRTDKLACGLFWQDNQEKAYHQEDVTLKNGPLVKQDISKIDITPLLKQFS
jgi:2-oxoglutarate/2-oxoacid ferredoxin oxidoreductase subunit beta